MVMVIAHKGASGYERGNSAKAIRKAIELGSDAIEFDVHVTKDKNIIIAHDPSITNGNKRLVLRKTPLYEVAEVYKCKGHKVLLLDEALRLIKGKCIVKIDIKDKGMEGVILEKLNYYGYSEQDAIITTAISSVVKRLRKMSDNLVIEYGGFEKYEEYERMVCRAVKLKANILSPHFSITTQELISTAHINGLKVHAWTINNKGLATRFIKMGIDGITTDYPDIMKHPILPSSQ